MMAEQKLISVISIYCGTESEAVSLSQALVDKHLAACCNISTCASLYKWQGEMNEDLEWIVSVKTMARAIDKVMELIKSEHTYDLPSILIDTLVTREEDYNWVNESVLF